MLPFSIRLPNKNATSRITGTSARMNRVRRAFSVSTITTAPTSVTTWLSSVVRLLVSMVRIWVTSLDRRDDDIPHPPVGIKIQLRLCRWLYREVRKS